MDTFGGFLVERPFRQVELDLGHQGVGAVLVSANASYDRPAGGRTHVAPGGVALLDTLSGWTVLVPGHLDEVEPLMRDAVAGGGLVCLRLSAELQRLGVPGARELIMRPKNRLVDEILHGPGRPPPPTGALTVTAGQVKRARSPEATRLQPGRGSAGRLGFSGA